MIVFPRSFRLLHFQTSAGFGGDESNSLLLCRHLPEMRHHVAVYFGSGPMEQSWRKAGAEVSLLELDFTARGELVAGVARTVSAFRPDGVFLSSVVLLPLVLKGLDGFGGEILCHTGNPDATSLLTRLKFWAARAWHQPRVSVTMVHCSDYVRQSYRRNAFYREYRHEVAISAGLLSRSDSGVTLHIPREIARTDSVRVGMVARLDPIKNHRLVIDALPRLLQSYPKATLEFIGDGSERENLKRRVLEIGVGERVVFHGRLPSPFPVAREWDLFIYATTAAEGFGAALAEAITLGLPCVVTDIGPMREVGGGNDTVCYVPAESESALSQAAAELLDDYPRRHQMSQLARKRGEVEFDGSYFAQKIKAFLFPSPRSAAKAVVKSTAT